MLIIVPTPIGNLLDITLRSLEVLKSVDGIICEDSRRTLQLLNHYQIKKPLIILNDFNEQKMFPGILNLLIQGQKLALVSDAGTPLISDPGFKLVRAALEAKIKIDSLPGPSSVITALILSGLPPDKFMFLGYPPERQGQRKKLFENLRLHPWGLNPTFIMFVSPHKIIRILEDMLEVLGDIEISLAHELTKLHQSVEKAKISDFLKSTNNPKGEYILLFHLDLT